MQNPFSGTASVRSASSRHGLQSELSPSFQSYVEHHLTLDELRDVHPDSYIDVNAPEKSDGLSSEEAKLDLWAF